MFVYCDGQFFLIKKDIRMRLKKFYNFQDVFFFYLFAWFEKFLGRLFCKSREGLHRDDWNNILKELNPKIKPAYFIKNFINIFKLIRIKNLIFSSLSDGMIYIFIVSFLRKIF